MSYTISKPKDGNFLTSFKDYIADFTKIYKEGLFALVVALITFGIERLLDKDLFNCPRTGYQAYGIAFFVCPIILLTLLNLLTMPADDGQYIWSLCERCWVLPYRRRGDFLGGFLSALCVGLVAPTFWTFLALLDAQHLVCWELGYKFGDNVTDSYLDARGFGYFTTSRYNEKIHEAEAKSHTIAVIFLGAIAIILFGVVVIRKSYLKPFDNDDRLPGLWKFEKLEASAARHELDRLLSEGDEFDQFSATLSLLQFLVIKERILSLEKELKEIQTNEKKTREIDLEISEFKELERVLHFWSEWYRLDVKMNLEMIPEDKKKSVTDAKTAYEGRSDKLTTKRATRMAAAKKIFDKYENPTDGEVSSVETAEAIHQAWLFARLEQQKSFFDVEDLVERWKKINTDEMKSLKQNLDSDSGVMESPEVRGRIVASYIIQLYKNRNDYCQTVEEVLELFKSIYPRIATSNPKLRYVDDENPMYRYIIEDEGKTVSGEKVKVPLLYTCVKPWEEANYRDWEKYCLKRNHKHSWFWRISGCRNQYCPLRPPSIATVEDGRRPLIT